MFSPTGERGTIHLIDLQSVNLAGEDFLFCRRPGWRSLKKEKERRIPASDSPLG